MSRIIRWGILGCGKIARKFASDLSLVENAELLAVGSNDEMRGKEFASTFNAARVYNNYQGLVTDPDVDVIYIATPHGFHHDHAMLCLEHKKAVLCEKAFALNARDARAMINYARRQNVFIMEAFWTKFIPQYRKVVELILADEIGEIKWIQADFGFNAGEVPAQRLTDPVLGGGALLDIGIYPVFLAQSLLGKPVEITSMMTPYPSGVDEQCLVNMKFERGAMASLSCTLASETPVAAVIAGTKGRITMKNRFHNAIGELELQIGKEAPMPIEVHREDGFGYQFEARHVSDCLRRGLTESPVMKHTHTIDLMKTLDVIRKQCGIEYPADAQQ